MAVYHTTALVRMAGATLLLTAAAVAEAQGMGEAPFSAQRRPRVAVLAFDNKNAEAAKTRYASSVEAMLVTFLQQKSQVVVVERKELGGLNEEKRRIQMGQVDVPPGDTAALKLLEGVDAYILGGVTLLDGPRIEIDVKIISRFDGRVVAAAQRSGPPDCLRPVVERLGVALEREYLRPYLSHLEVRLTVPENVSISLTPIPLDTAPDEERAPTDRSSTIKMDVEYDTVEPWITNPTSYTISNLLPGWYSLRLERAGYEDLKTDFRRWEVRRRAGGLDVFDRRTDLPLSESDPELRRFVVRVETGTTTTIDGGALGFVFRKIGGSLAPRVKRQYLDKDYKRSPQRAVLMGSHGLEINHSTKPFETREDQRCNLLRELPPLLVDYGRTHIVEGQTFDIEAFRGGELIIDDYQGETVPAGRYKMVVWDPYFDKQKVDVVIHDGERQKEARVSLPRDTLPLKLETTGAQLGHRVILKGRETHYGRMLPLDFTGIKEVQGLPADTYTVSTNVPGLTGWKRTFEHLPGIPIAPRYHTSNPASPETTRTYEDKGGRREVLIVKTSFVLAGRLGLLHRRPDPRKDDLFRDDEAGKLLDKVLAAPDDTPDELRELVRRLDVIDLLVLGPQDMVRFRESPKLAALVRDYVEKGGALFAFVSEPGDYGEIVGAPLDLPARRPLPEAFGLPSWRVLAFTDVLKRPRILERGEKEKGGYVALWLDAPAAFRDSFGRTRVEEIRGRVEERVLAWARFLMYRRYDKSGKLRQRAEAEIEP
ncbi:MAG TPA: CsgG/HfaB family protein [Thermoanaerobaculia bacterium]